MRPALRLLPLPLCIALSLNAQAADDMPPNWSLCPVQDVVKPFAEALVKLKKGEMTKTPVQTQFGWHIIQLQDERALKMPTFDEAKNQLVQMMSQQSLQKAVADLRSKAKITE